MFKTLFLVENSVYYFYGMMILNTIVDIVGAYLSNILF